MTRISSNDLVNIIEWQDGSNGPMIPLAPFIAQAHGLTNWLHKEDRRKELDEDALTQIETQLAAHFYSVQRDLPFQSKNTSGASGSFQGATGLSLQSTHYGQTALLLDVTSLLAKRNLEAQHGRRVSKTVWLGSPGA